MAHTRLSHVASRKESSRPWTCKSESTTSLSSSYLRYQTLLHEACGSHDPHLKSTFDTNIGNLETAPLVPLAPKRRHKLPPGRARSLVPHHQVYSRIRVYGPLAYTTWGGEKKKVESTNSYNTNSNWPAGSRQLVAAGDAPRSVAVAAAATIL